jgi:ATP-dependent Clp protease ATP-binding subunit ClpC
VDDPITRDLPLGELSISDALRRLLADARREAEELDHEYIGTEHLVLALAPEAGHATMLVRLGVDRARLREELLATLTPGSSRHRMPPGPNPYTERTRLAFRFAAEEARASGRGAVGVEQLVVGLLRERGNVGAQLLTYCGATMARALAIAAETSDAP